MEVTLVINIFNIYCLFLSKRYILYLINFMGSENIIFKIIIIILIKILYSK